MRQAHLSARAGTDGNGIVGQGLEWCPGEAAADIFVGGRRLRNEDPVPLTKIQPVQDR